MVFLTSLVKLLFACCICVLLIAGGGSAQSEKSVAVKVPTLVAVGIRQGQLKQVEPERFVLLIPDKMVTSVVVVTDRPQHIASHLPLKVLADKVFRPLSEKVSGVVPHTNVILELKNRQLPTFVAKVIHYKINSRQMTLLLQNINISSPLAEMRSFNYTGPVSMFFESNRDLTEFSSGYPRSDKSLKLLELR